MIGMAINVLAQRDGNFRLGVAPFLGLEQIAHDDLGLDRVGHLDADGAFAGHGREDVNALGLERGGDVVGKRGDFFQLHARRRMQFVARDGRAFGDVAERNLDLKLRERLLHEPRVGHQFLLRFGGLDGQVRVLEKIQRRQLVIADDGRGGDRNRFRFPWRPGFGRSGRHRVVGDVNDRFGFFTIGFLRPQLFPQPPFPFWLQPVFPRLPVFCPALSSVVAAAPLRAAAAARPAWRDWRLPVLWPVRAGWFCARGRTPVWPAARSNRGRSAPAPAAYPRPGRNGRLPPAVFSPAFRVRGRGVRARFRRRIRVRLRRVLF